MLALSTVLAEEAAQLKITWPGERPVKGLPEKWGRLQSSKRKLMDPGMDWAVGGEEELSLKLEPIEYNNTILYPF